MNRSGVADASEKVGSADAGVWGRRAGAWRPGGGLLVAVGLLTALVMWVFRHHLLSRWSFPWDFLGTYSTTPAFVADTFGRGHPLFWSPFVASGFPVDVSPQAGVYFPGWWILGALHIAPTLRVLTAVQVLHVLLGGVGVLALARARGIALLWATVAAVAYLFFGGFYGQAEHADIVRGFAYLPWLLWALTPPVDRHLRWTRLVAVPPLAWLIVSGAYPGELVSFALMGLTYLAVELARDRTLVKRYRGALASAGMASLGVSLAVLLPYIRADQAGELFRTVEPTATIRSIYALSPLDFFGLYLNNFAWTYEGTVTAWAVGTPVLVGFACAGRATLRRHLPLLVTGALALALAMTPKIAFVGKAMASARPLFLSRFPSSDYKAVVALALILIAADAWCSLAKRTRKHLLVAAMLSACVLIGGIFLAPATHAQPTGERWLVIVVVVAAAVLAVGRLPAQVLAVLLVILIVIDGSREANDYLLAGTVSPWKVSPAALSPFLSRNVLVRLLPQRLKGVPTRRPARVPPAPTAEANASGWLGDAYHETDYDPTVERVLWRAEHNPQWSAMLLAPWNAYTFPCAAVGCSSRRVQLPAVTTWRTNPDVTTLSYGSDAIRYSVRLSRPALMVENELAIPGWHADTTRVRSVATDLPFRAWRLDAGRYVFSTSYQEPARLPQELALIVAVLAWVGCLIGVRGRQTAL